jgi:chromosome partitioning protein
MSIYAVTNQIPASGRTTTAVSLATYLGAFGARVLLVDLDPRGDATAAVGRARTMALSHALRHNLPITRCVAPSAVPRVDLFNATADLATLSHRLPDAEDAVRRSLLVLAGGYTYTLIDCPTEPRMLQQAALSAADLAIVPIARDQLTDHDLARSLETVEAARARSSRHLSATLLLTMDGAPPINAARLRHAARQPVFRASIPSDERLDDVLNGRSILDVRSSGVHAYERLAIELATHAVAISA